MGSKPLLDRAREGDRLAREELLVSEQSSLQAFVRLRRPRAQDPAESVSDLVQSILLSALDDEGLWQAEDAPALRRRFLLRAEHAVVDRARHHHRARRDVRRNIALDDAADPEALLVHYRSLSTPSRALRAKEEVTRIEDAFAQLPADHARVIVLIRFVGLEIDQAAEELGRSKAATWTLLSRALARLSTLLQPDPEHPQP